MRSAFPERKEPWLLIGVYFTLCFDKMQYFDEKNREFPVTLYEMHKSEGGPRSWPPSERCKHKGGEMKKTPRYRKVPGRSFWQREKDSSGATRRSRPFGPEPDQ